MKAFVLCGGQGTRLRPLTYENPKPMLKVGGKTILEYVIANLKKQGITDIVLTVGYLKEKIKAYFGNGKKFGVNIEYLEEDYERFTAGSVLPYKGKIKEDFVVLMGDQITNIDLKKMMEFHKKNGGIATIALKKKTYKWEYGIAELKGNSVLGFKEKPEIESYINTAIYCFKPEIFEYINDKEDFAKNVFPRLLEKKKKIIAYLMEEEWVDIGRMSDYEEINKNLEKIGFTKRFF